MKIKYTIIKELSVISLEILVNRMIDEEGYQPLGGVSIAKAGEYHTDITYCQAMIKEVDE